MASGERQVIDLSTLGSDGAVGLRDTLLVALKEGRPVTLDAGMLDEAQSALVQVVESAALSFRTSGVAFELRAPGDALIAAYEDLGLFANLMSITAVD